jgi:hypothetical protein
MNNPESAVRPIVSSAEYEGGLDREQRAFLIEQISSRFAWLTDVELAGLINASEKDVEILRREHKIVSFMGKRGLLTPDYTVQGHGLNPAIEVAVTELSGELRDWEILLWLHGGNGILDGESPVDQNLEQMKTAVRNELEQ